MAKFKLPDGFERMIDFMGPNVEAAIIAIVVVCVIGGAYFYFRTCNKKGKSHAETSVV